MTETSYTTMAKVYDRWMLEEKTPYRQWSAFIISRFEDSPLQVESVLDVGCGTGEMAKYLVEADYRVTGLDPSREMVRLARAKLGGAARILLGEAGDEAASDFGPFQAVISCFDVINYLRDETELRACFTWVAKTLQPGGIFIFDVNTRAKLEDFYANNHHGDDWGDIAYIWRSRYLPENHDCLFLLTFFLQDATGTWSRHTERHLEHWFAHEEVKAAARKAGFEVLEVVDAYSDRPVAPDTRRETWVLHLPRC